MRGHRQLRVLLAAAFLILAPALAQAQTDPWAKAMRKPGPIGPISAKTGEEAWFVPGGPGPDGTPALLKARVFLPSGAGPFKVAVVVGCDVGDEVGRPVEPDFLVANDQSIAVMHGRHSG